MLIIIMLMVFFLGGINNSSILDALKMVPEEAVTVTLCLSIK